MAFLSSYLRLFGQHFVHLLEQGFQSFNVVLNSFFVFVSLPTRHVPETRVHQDNVGEIFFRSVLLEFLLNIFGEHCNLQGLLKALLDMTLGGKKVPG